MNLHDLVDHLELPPTHVAEGAWDAAARRTRRRRATLAAVSAAAAAVLVAAFVVTGRPDGPPPTNGPVSTPTASTAPIVTPDMRTPGAYGSQTFERLHGEPTAPPARPAPLSTSPIPYAKLVLTPGPESTEVLLLGPDDTWRRLDVPLVPVDDGAGYRSTPFRPTALSPDATMLALPQPSALVVVDLTDGSHRSHPVPSPHLVYANWLSDSRVVVSTEHQPTGWEVDLDDGTVSESRFGPSTARAPDGQLVTWGMGARGFSTPMDWDNGTAVTSAYNNNAGLHPSPPLVDDSVVVGHHSTTHTGIGLPLSQNAMVVVDRRTGGPLAYLPTTRAKGDFTTLLGWHKGDVVLSLRGKKVPGREHAVALAAWDWTERRLEPLITVTGWHVAWGRGW